MDNYRNKRVLVTGGTGFIGTRLAERLALEEKAEVRVLVHTWSKAAWVSRSDVSLVQGDITQPDEVDKAVMGSEVVFHCVGVGGSLEQCMKTNLDGTKNVLNSCKKFGVKRIVYISSVVVHGAEVFDGMNEIAPYKNTGNAYADSKIEAEKYFLSFIKNNGIEGTAIRPTYVWGPMSPWYTVDVVKQMQSGSFMLVNGGEGSCNAVYIDNVVDILLICGFHPKAVGEIFLITDGERLTWKEFWSYYSKMIKVDIAKFPSIPSIDSLNRKINKCIKRFLIVIRDKLSELIGKLDKKYPVLTRYSLRAARKAVKLLLLFVSSYVLEMNSWDVQIFSSFGFISLEKAKTFLNYTPRVNVKQGMIECEEWLRDQNYI